MSDFIFILQGVRYVISASDFEAATGHMNEIRDGWGAGYRWILAKKPNIYKLG